MSLKRKKELEFSLLNELDDEGNLDNFDYISSVNVDGENDILSDSDASSDYSDVEKGQEEVDDDSDDDSDDLYNDGDGSDSEEENSDNNKTENTTVNKNELKFKNVLSAEKLDNLIESSNKSIQNQMVSKGKLQNKDTSTSSLNNNQSEVESECLNDSCFADIKLMKSKIFSKKEFKSKNINLSFNNNQSDVNSEDKIKSHENSLKIKMNSKMDLLIKDPSLSLNNSQNNEESDDLNSTSNKIISKKSKSQTKTVKENNANSSTKPNKNSDHPQLLKKSDDGDKVNEYAEDSSDEEDLRNTIGNVPINWYDEYPHLGYNLDGIKIIKPVRGDTLDNFLNRLENPDYNRTVLDKQTGQDVRLSDEDLDIVQRLLSSRVPDQHYEMHGVWHDLYSHEVMDMPVTGRPEHKRSFVPSKLEMEKVGQIVHRIKMGLYNPPQKARDQKWKFNYNLWKNDENERFSRSIQQHLHAPKMMLPGHAESYNPPPEYLLTKEELAKEHQNKLDPNFKARNFIPKKFSCVRKIPAYNKFVKDRFERCLDLYLAPRKKYRRITAKSSDLLPVLPRPKDLRPFPTTEALVFRGHRSIIRSISVRHCGKFLASGSDDHTVKIWEISTGRCLRSFDVEGAVHCVAWNPNPKLFMLAVVFENKVVFLNPETYLTDKVVVQQTNSVFKAPPDQGDYIAPERIAIAAQWAKPTIDEWAKGYRVVLTHFKAVKQVVWHRQGDYFATLVPEGDNRSVMMHQLSRWRSQIPFSKTAGRVQCITFHPKYPFLYVCTQQHIRVYDLQKQKRIKDIQANSRWISSIAVHPGGEHFIIGTYDRRVSWFEMEYTKRPHILRYHKAAVRNVAFHRKYPLFASVSDEGKIVIAHGMVYNDWLRDPTIVPVKELGGHARFDDLTVLDVTWHPFEPYVFTSGADALIKLWN